MKRQASGFTLIELVIVIVIVAILAAIALPSYTRYIVRGNRAAAQSYLMDVAQREQQYLLDNRGYANQATMLGIDPLPTDVSSFYTVTITPDNTQTPPIFNVRAVPLAGTMQAVAAYNEPILKIDQAGNKTPPKVWQ